MAHHDTINRTDQRPVLGDEKASQEHIEGSTDTGTQPQEWEEEKPKLNLQMALAFIVRSPRIALNLQDYFQ